MILARLLLGLPLAYAMVLGFHTLIASAWGWP